MSNTHVYGYCPVPGCDAPGRIRERHPNGNDTCTRGHYYPSRTALIEQQVARLGSTLGYCPNCGESGKYREKRPNGNDTCFNGHEYPSSAALTEKPAAEPITTTDWREHLATTFERTFARRHPNRSLLKLRAGAYQDPNTHDAWLMFRDGAISMAQFNRDMLAKFNEEQ